MFVFALGGGQPGCRLSLSLATLGATLPVSLGPSISRPPPPSREQKKTDQLTDLLRLDPRLLQEVRHRPAHHHLRLEHRRLHVYLVVGRHGGVDGGGQVGAVGVEARLGVDLVEELGELLLEVLLCCVVVVVVVVYCVVGFVVVLWL